MRKMMLLLPLLLLPALADAGPRHQAKGAAWELNAAAWRVSDRVENLPGNWRLKREAYRFAKASSRLVRSVRYDVRPRRVVRRLERAETRFHSLRKAARQARLTRPERRRLARQLRRLSFALDDVNVTLRRAYLQREHRSRGRYRQAAHASARYGVRRYRD